MWGLVSERAKLSPCRLWSRSSDIVATLLGGLFSDPSMALLAWVAGVPGGPKARRDTHARRHVSLALLGRCSRTLVHLASAVGSTVPIRGFWFWQPQPWFRGLPKRWELAGVGLFWYSGPGNQGRLVVAPGALLFGCIHVNSPKCLSGCIPAKPSHCSLWYDVMEKGVLSRQGLLNSFDTAQETWGIAEAAGPAGSRCGWAGVCSCAAPDRELQVPFGASGG